MAVYDATVLILDWFKTVNDAVMYFKTGRVGVIDVSLVRDLLLKSRLIQNFGKGDIFDQSQINWARK